MSDTIQVGDRVAWRSTRANHKGLYRRVGVVLKIFEAGYKYPYAWVRPDKGNGHLQYIGMPRLTKMEVQP